MINPVKRSYSTKDVDMIVASEIIINSAIANKIFLQSKRSTWADPFFQNIKTQINTAAQTHLGVDNALQLRQATHVVLSIQANALRDLAEVKIQIIEDFKETPTQQAEILTQLGFSTYHAKAQKRDQEALINLLYQFQTNLKPALKIEIVSKGTAQASLDAIVAYAITLKDSNVTQEGTKGTRKEITQEAIIEFNSIYSKIVSITKIAAKFYKDNPALSQQFSFAKVSKTLNIIK
jgi:hypothetical protein